MIGVSSKVLIAAQSLDERLSAGRVARALASGLEDDCSCAAEIVKLEGGLHDPQLDPRRFDERMKACRAAVIVTPKLDEHTLLRSAPFEIATRARQAGVPCFAVTKENALHPFDARILDLQVVIEARSEKSLRFAGLKLAESM